MRNQKVMPKKKYGENERKREGKKKLGGRTQKLDKRGRAASLSKRENGENGREREREIA